MWTRPFGSYLTQCTCILHSIAYIPIHLRYLELSNWILKDAIQSAREDFGWETNIDGQQQNNNNNQQQLRAGEIRVMMDLTSRPDQGPLLTFRAQGAGYGNRKSEEEEKTNREPADPHHNAYGLEMSSFSK
jgi:hypothetical protein